MKAQGKLIFYSKLITYARGTTKDEQQLLLINIFTHSEWPTSLCVARWVLRTGQISFSTLGFPLNPRSMAFQVRSICLFPLDHILHNFVVAMM
mmetsp:Transcript_5062/g.11259  ORF Transcript_5062/g.11259 Transcript_5062/m.11259 type:complete len:93 (+) Transcript_5062:124-402(+)